MKLIARAIKTENGIFLKTEPVAVKRSHPLYSIEDVFNGILIKSDISGDLMFYGKGAGRLPTAGAVISDVIDIVSRGDDQPKQQLWTRDENAYIPVLPDDLFVKSLDELGYPLGK